MSLDTVFNLPLSTDTLDSLSGQRDRLSIYDGTLQSQSHRLYRKVYRLLSNVTCLIDIIFPGLFFCLFLKEMRSGSWYDGHRHEKFNFMECLPHVFLLLCVWKCYWFFIYRWADAQDYPYHQHLSVSRLRSFWYTFEFLMDFLIHIGRHAHSFLPGNQNKSLDSLGREKWSKSDF